MKQHPVLTESHRRLREARQKVRRARDANAPADVLHRLTADAHNALYLYMQARRIAGSFGGLR